MNLWLKFKNLSEIALLPRGFQLKLGDPAFDLQVLKVCHRLQSSGIVPEQIFDVGANVGQFASMAAATFPNAEIHSFEPGEDALKRLRIVPNRYPNVRVHECALGEVEGEADLHVTSASQSSSLLPLGEQHKSLYPAVQEVGRQKVRVSTLSKEAGLLKPSGKHLLKLDVQGAELQVLRGGRGALAAFEWILLETSMVPLYQGEATFDAIQDFLKEEGFEFLTPADLHLTDDGKFGQFDALFRKMTDNG